MTRKVESDPGYVSLDGGLRGPALAFAYLLDSVSGWACEVDEVAWTNRPVWSKVRDSVTVFASAWPRKAPTKGIQLPLPFL